MSESKVQGGDGQPPEDQWHLEAPLDGAVGINAKAAWRHTKGAGVKVIVLDTGVECDHPSLARNIDREHARDFDNTIDPRRRPTRSRIANRFDAHGTACAGIVAAVERQPTDAGIPDDCAIVGVAPEARIVPLRISTNFDEACLLAALEHAAEDGVGHVVLMPRHLPHTKAIEAALAKLASTIPVVCAAGNNGTSTLIYPASHPGTIAVGACNSKGYRSTYSQYGAGLDVVAPSNDVWNEDRDLVRLDPDEVKQRIEEHIERSGLRPDGHSTKQEQDELAKIEQEVRAASGVEFYSELSIATTDNLGYYGYNSDPAGDYCRAKGNYGFGGTSAACAEVAGVVALMLAVNPKLGPSKVKKILLETASHGNLKAGLRANGREVSLTDEFGAGLVDAEEAVARAKALAERV